MSGNEIEPTGTYRPQYRLRWRGLVRLLDRFPGMKARLADLVRRLLTKVFDPAVVTTERVVEYPFVYQNLACPDVSWTSDASTAGSPSPRPRAGTGWSVSIFFPIPTGIRTSRPSAEMPRALPSAPPASTPWWRSP